MSYYPEKKVVYLVGLKTRLDFWLRRTELFKCVSALQIVPDLTKIKIIKGSFAIMTSDKMSGNGEHCYTDENTNSTPKMFILPVCLVCKNIVVETGD